MKRRKFLGFAALGTAAVAAGGAYVFFEDFEALARRIIMKDTASLNIDAAEYDKFFADVKKARRWDALFQTSHRQLLKWHFHVDNGLFRLPYAGSYQANRSKLVGMFLLSTNFFQNRMDPSKPVKYNMLFDPYLSPCSNPFSNLYYPNV